MSGIEEKIYRPQPGPQEIFTASPADIRVIGGAAGGGKTFILLLDFLRDIANPLYRATIFRRESTQLMKPGGIWDESQGVYRDMGGVPRSSPSLEWLFPERPKAKSGAKIQFSHLNQLGDIYAWQGSQQSKIGFEELVHFLEKQFFYMLSRIRSVSGASSGVAATCNPDPDSWVKPFIRWWLDEEGRYADPSKTGVLRWFIRVKGEMVWAASKREMLERYPKDGQFAKSVTFIPALLSDNRILMAKDPAYEANLNALPLVDRERLKNGDWLIRESAGNVFRREWFEAVDAVPAGGTVIRYWDRAGTEDPKKKKKITSSDPDYTVGLKLRRAPSGIFYVENIVRFRATAHKVEEAIKATATQDGRGVSIGIEQDPGQAGKAEASYLLRSLSGYDVRAFPVTKDKITRSKPASAQAEAGNIKVLRAPWTEDFFRELENFPGGAHDDIVDALSGATNALSEMAAWSPWVG